MAKEDSLVQDQKQNDKSDQNNDIQLNKQDEINSANVFDKYNNSKLHLIDHEQEEFELKRLTLKQQFKKYTLCGFTKNSKIFYQNHKLQILVELGAGIEIAFHQIPETVVYSIIARINPLAGIYATFFMNLFSSVFGFNGGLMSAASPAFAVLIRMFFDEEGPLEKYTYEEKFQHMSMTLLFAGIFQLVTLFLKLPKYIRRLASPSAKITFYNILAVHIFIALLQELFQYCGDKDDTENFMICKQKDLEFHNFGNSQVWIAITYIAFVMMCIFVIPRIPYVGKIIPPSIFALIIVSIYEHHGNRESIQKAQRTVGETFQLDNAFPTWEAPKQNGDINDGYDWGFIFTYGIILCIVGIFETIESVKKLQKQNNYISPNFGLYQESLAQSIGNLFCSLFGGMGGSGNVRSSTLDSKQFHAQGKISSFIATWVFILAALLGYEAIEKIPLSALGGVMFYNLLSDFNFQTLWMTLKRKITVKEISLIVLGTVIGGLSNIFYGTVFVVAIFNIASSWNEAEKLQIDIYYCKENIQGNPDKKDNIIDANKKVKVYKVTGKIFFSSVRNLLNSLKPDTDSEHVVIDLTNSDLSDCSGVNALNDMTNRYSEKNKRLWAHGLNQESLQKISVSKGLGDKIQQVPSNCLDNFLELLKIKIEKKEDDENTDKKDENTNIQVEMQQQQGEKYKEVNQENSPDNENSPKDILYKAQDQPKEEQESPNKVVEVIRKVSRKISENFTIHNMEEDHNDSMQLEKKAIQYQLQRNQEEDDDNDNIVILDDKDVKEIEINKEEQMNTDQPLNKEN